ncbi:hypothetical protein QBE52_01575 [Clostridiaceae bacterium 35-E11]
MYPYYNNAYYDPSQYYYYCEMEAKKIYPEIYRELHPYVKKVCEREDHMYNPMMHPFPNQEAMENMINEIYENYNEEKKYRKADRGYGSGGIIRDIITIILIGELLGRRRRRIPYYY